MTSPDPVPLPRELLAAIVTTEGTTLSATAMTGQALTVDEDAELLEPDDWDALTIRPPTTPPTTSAVPSATHSSHPLGLRAWPDSLTTAPKSRSGRSDSHSERAPRSSNCLTGPQDHPVGSSRPFGMSSHRFAARKVMVIKDLRPAGSRMLASRRCH